MKAQEDSKGVRKRVLRERTLCETHDFSPSWLDREVAAGRFPAPIKLSPAGNGRAKGWLAHEVDEWLAARIAERDRAA